MTIEVKSLTPEEAAAWGPVIDGSISLPPQVEWWYLPDGANSPVSDRVGPFAHQVEAYESAFQNGEGSPAWGDPKIHVWCTRKKP